jgi:hypothetical protein
MVVTNLLINFQNWIIHTFNKEGIAVFCLMCIAFFAFSAILATWAITSGQFKNVEEAKFEMLDF